MLVTGQARPRAPGAKDRPKVMMAVPGIPCPGRAGRKSPAMIAPAMTTPPATTHPPCRLCKKAPLALFARACPAWVRPAWARTRDAAIAAPTDAFAADAACAGRWAGAVEASRLE